MKRTETILEIWKRLDFLRWWTGLLFTIFIYNFFEYFNNHKKKNNRAVGFSCRTLPSILKCEEHIWDLPTICKIHIFQILLSKLLLFSWSGLTLVIHCMWYTHVMPFLSNKIPDYPLKSLFKCPTFWKIRSKNSSLYLYTGIISCPYLLYHLHALTYWNEPC